VLTIAVASDDPSKIDVTIGLKPETPIRKGVIAGISTLGLVGDYYILLTQKPGADQPLSPGSQIPSRHMMEMGDLLVKAAELSQTLSASVDSVMGAINRLLSDENISHVQTALQGMGRLTIEGEKSLQLVTADIRNVLKRLNSLVVNAENLTTENKDNIKDTVLAIKTLAERMDVLVRNIDGTLSENREDLRATVAAIREDSQKAGQLIDHLDGRIDVTGDYLDETLINLMEVSENLRLLSTQLRRQPWRLIYRGGVKK
jgi:ABC-type transporter Mla subunit MlaD